MADLSVLEVKTGMHGNAADAGRLGDGMRPRQVAVPGQLSKEGHKHMAIWGAVSCPCYTPAASSSVSLANYTMAFL